MKKNRESAPMAKSVMCQGFMVGFAAPLILFAQSSISEKSLHSDSQGIKWPQDNIRHAWRNAGKSLRSAMRKQTRLFDESA